MPPINFLNRRPEIWVFALLILLANLTLLGGRVCEEFIFKPELVAAGQWGRVVTFPLVHVSGYHLLLDASAFLFLYYGLQTPSFKKRALYVAGSAAGSLLLSIASSPLTDGLCGLSGIAHGLMAITGLEMMQNNDSLIRKSGIGCLAFVVIKSLHESLSGHVALEFLHWGSVGNPVPTCHLGGVVGGMIIFGLIWILKFIPSILKQKTNR